MTPNISKQGTDTSKFAGQEPGAPNAGNNPHSNPVTDYNPAGKASVLSSDGAIGSNFKADGALGSIPQSIGGPLSKDGIIGNAFTETGAIGGTANKILGHTPSEVADKK